MGKDDLQGLPLPGKVVLQQECERSGAATSSRQEPKRHRHDPSVTHRVRQAANRHEELTLAIIAKPRN